MIVKICEIAQFTRATPGSSLVIYIRGQKNDPPVRETLFFSVCSRNFVSLGLMPLNGSLELTTGVRPSRALTATPTCTLLCELQRNKATFRCASLCADVPEHRQEQLMQTLIVRLIKTLFLLFQKFWGAQPRPPLSSDPLHSGKSLFFQTSVAIVIVILAEMGRIPCCGRPESSSSIIW